MYNKKILVTGANGLVANHLIEKCIKMGAIVYAVDIIEPKNQILKYKDNSYVFIKSDLREYRNCIELCENIDVVFHLAGIKGSPKRSSESPADFFVPMLQFNTNIMEAARISDVEWFVYTSSVGVYSPAEIFYEEDVWSTFPSEKDRFPGWAKRIGELQSEAYKISYNWNKISIIRPANIYGSYDTFSDKSTVIASLIKRLFGENENPLICWGDGTPIRDFIHASDVADGILSSYFNKITEPINLGSGTGTTIKELAEILAEIYREMYNIEVKIIWDTEKPNGDSKRILSTQKAESYGIFQKINLKDGLKETINHYITQKK